MESLLSSVLSTASHKRKRLHHEPPHESITLVIIMIFRHGVLLIPFGWPPPLAPMCAYLHWGPPRSLDPRGVGARPCLLYRPPTIHEHNRTCPNAIEERHTTPVISPSRATFLLFSFLFPFLLISSLLFPTLPLLPFPSLLFSSFLFPSFPFPSLSFSSLLFFFFFLGEGGEEAPCIDTTSIDRYYCLHPLLWAVLLLSSVLAYFALLSPRWILASNEQNPKVRKGRSCSAFRKLATEERLEKI